MAKGALGQDVLIRIKNINIIKFLVEHSVSELINFCLFSTETFVYQTTFRTKTGGLF